MKSRINRKNPMQIMQQPENECGICFSTIGNDQKSIVCPAGKHVTHLICTEGFLDQRLKDGVDGLLDVKKMKGMLNSFFIVQAKSIPSFFPASRISKITKSGLSSLILNRASV